MRLVRAAGWVAALFGGLVVGAAVALGRGHGSRFLIQNRSMLPALQPGDRVLVSALSLRLRPPRRGDLVVFHDPERPGRLAIKRVVGLQGEAAPWAVDRPPVVAVAAEAPAGAGAAPTGAGPGRPLGLDELLVVGDNLIESRDSRAYGPISRRRLVGRAWYRYWPPERRGRLRPAQPTFF